MAIINAMHKYQPTMIGGSNWMHIIVDFKGDKPSAGDDIRVAEIKSGWIVRDSFWKCSVVGSGAGAVDISTTQGGTEIASAASVASTGNWARGSLTPAAIGAYTSDGYIWVEPAVAQALGKLELLIEVIIAARDMEIG